MADPQFIHLRVHSAYSLSEGAMKMPALVANIQKLGFPAVAVTDTANMFGAKAFSHMAPDAGIKPILGCQFFLRNADADDVLKSKGRTVEPDKIVLLVQNEQGYANIMKLMHRSYLVNPGYAERAQLKLSDLQELNEGLIMLTGGSEGPLGRLFLENRAAEAEAMLQQLKEAFGDRLYMEVSRIGTPEERKTEDIFIKWAYDYNIPLVRPFSLMPKCMKRMMRWFVLLPANMSPMITAKSFRPTTGCAARPKWSTCFRICRRLCKIPLILPGAVITIRILWRRCCRFLNVPTAKLRTNILSNRRPAACSAVWKTMFILRE